MGVIRSEKSRVLKPFYKVRSRRVGTPVTPFFWLGAIMGFSGVGSFFIPEILTSSFNTQTLTGVLFAFIGTLLFSFGSIVSIKLSSHGISPFTANCYAMLYGSAFLLALILFSGSNFTFDTSPSYWLSLLYLAIPASVFGFTLYLRLVNIIGAGYASYALVLTPLAALLLSSIFESFEWIFYSLIGVILVITGYKTSQIKRNH